MNMDLVITKLNEKGYNSVLHDVITNTTVNHGVSIMETCISPCMHIDELLFQNPSYEPDALVTELINTYNSSKHTELRDFTPHVPIYIVSNSCLMSGQAHVLDKSAILAFARKHNTNKLIILPATKKNQLIVLPAAIEELDLYRFDSMTIDTGAAQVKPEEQLADRAYILHVEE